MKKIVLFEHAGSYNHGCEAIIRSTARLFKNNNVELYSFRIQEDLIYGVDEVCNVYSCSNDLKRDLLYFSSRFFSRYFHNDYFYWKLSYSDFLKGIRPENIYLSTGGDNYCYKSKIKGCMFLNSQIKKRGGKTVLWGVSIEPDLLKKKKVRKDLLLYDLIVARETITFNALKENGINNICLCPDPAFTLPSAKISMPENFEDKDIIGINISPMILDFAQNSNLIMNNYIKLVNYLLKNTDYSIALIPHVVWNGGDDRVAIKELLNHIEQSERILIIDDANCETLKGYISKCKFFIGARTHTTIASYSMNIPTIVVGYSVKAKGIATDIFGTDNGYVIDVRDCTDDNQLLNAFIKMEKKEKEIINTLIESKQNYNQLYTETIKKVESL